MKENTHACLNLEKHYKNSNFGFQNIFDIIVHTVVAASDMRVLPYHVSLSQTTKISRVYKKVPLFMSPNTYNEIAMVKTNEANIFAIAAKFGYSFEGCCRK